MSATTWTGKHSPAFVTRADRLWIANRALEIIASHGRQFFRHENRVGYFDLGPRARVWFVDAYTRKRIYTHDRRSRWRGFTGGGTLRALAYRMSRFIFIGQPLPALTFGPYPEWLCNRDPWGYGEDMAVVRSLINSECPGLMDQPTEAKP